MMINHRGANFTLGALAKMLVLQNTDYGEVVFGDAYMDGKITVEGNLADWIEAQQNSNRWLPYMPTTSRRVADHYDIPPEFYKIMLGESMTYTCANFSGHENDLDAAQQAKIKRHASWLPKLGKAFHMDCGCGWGTYAEYLSKANPLWKIDAITLSPEQATYAAANYPGVWVLPRSWEAIGVKGIYNSFSSIGMLEHVGKEKIPEYFTWVSRILTDDGVGTLQFCSRDTPISKWADKYPMPGCYPPNLNEVTRAMNASGLQITDLIECGQDYAKTCECWLENIEKNIDEIKELGFDDRFIRMYRLFLSGGVASFRQGDTQLYQLRFEKR